MYRPDTLLFFARNVDYIIFLYNESKMIAFICMKKSEKTRVMYVTMTNENRHYTIGKQLVKLLRRDLYECV